MILGAFQCVGFAQVGPSITNPANGHSYRLVSLLLTPAQASAYAASLGGYLVSINNTAENAWIVSTFGPLQGANAWIGLNDAAVEGTFVWDSGETTTYGIAPAPMTGANAPHPPWVGGEPNNNGNEDYVEIKLNSNTSWPGQWNDMASTATNFAIVEIVAPTVVWISNPANCHLYARIVQPLTYAAARAQATALGGYLVAINDAAENSFIMQQFTPYINGRYDWIGLTDEITEGTFLWESGEPLSYTNWMGGEPNNLNNEDYASINLNDQGHPTSNYGAWNDYGAVTVCNALVEIPSTPSFSLSGSSGIGGSNMTLSAVGVPCGGFAGATLVSMTLPPSGLGTGPVFGLLPDAFTIQLLLMTQPFAPPNVQPWRFDLGLAGSSTCYPYASWVAPWGSMQVLPAGLTIDMVLVIATPTGLVGSNVLRLPL